MDDSLGLITLTSPGHHDLLASGLWDLFQSRCSVDFDLGRGVRVHRCVLDVFLSTGKLAGLLQTESSLKSMVEFLYTGQVTLHQDQVDNLLATAKESGFQLLVDAVETQVVIKSEQPLDTGLENSIRHQPEQESDDSFESDRRPDTNEGYVGLGSPVFEYVAPDVFQPAVRIKLETPETFDDDEGEGEAEAEAETEPRERAEVEPTPPFEQEKPKRPTRSATGDGTASRGVIADALAKPFVCSVCGLSFAYKVGLVTHNRLHTGEKPYQCVTCGKAFRLNRIRKQHERTHTGERPYRCVVCGLLFAASSSLRIHNIRRHKGGEKRYCCPCGKSFFTNRELKGHAKSHVKERAVVHTAVAEILPFDCDACGQWFVDEQRRNDHRCRHVEKTYVCAVCGRAFVTNYLLGIHLRSHSGEMPFDCEVCGKVFVSKRCKDRHSRIHSSERSHECEVCGKCFKFSGNLKKHAQVHSGERPFLCACGKAFARLHGLKVHAKTHTKRSQEVGAGPSSTSDIPTAI